MKTKVTELLGIEYPIVQGGMAWVAEANLAAAVSNAGGLGLIAGGSAPAEVIRAEIRRCRELTDRPFGVNIMLMSPNAEDLAQLVLDEKVPVVTTGAGSPGSFIPAWKAAGIKVIPVVASVALAKRMERTGADALVAEGCEAGGHIGELTTMVLVPQVAGAVSIPVIAAGGVADGRGMAAAFALGAQGVQCGTCFLASVECTVHENYKQKVLDANDIATVVNGRSHGHPVRQLKNRMAREYQRLEKEGADFDILESLTVGGLRAAVKDGDSDNGSLMAGQSAGMVNEILPVKTIIDNMVRGARDACSSLSAMLEP